MNNTTSISDLAPKFDPAAVEAEVFSTWMAEKCFAADPSAPGEPYCIVIPPPNVTGALHLGHAINNTLQDILIRVHRMKGFNTLWVPGVDHAGIATQAVVEKQLKEKENKTRHDVGREGLVERIWQWKQEYGDRIVSQLQRMGCSCDWDRQRFTLDDMCAKAVRETFFKMFKDGKVFRGKRLVNWDTHLQTSISDDELYTEAVKTNLWSIKYPIDGTDKFMTVATTRPETMLADTAVAVHPDDPRWNWAIGKNVRLPLTNRLIPIIGDPILVDMAFGSGCVKVTPAHDPNDYAVWQRQAGKIGILNLMTADGKVNDADPSWATYTGLRFKDARKKVVEDLCAGGFMNAETDIKPHEANVNFSDRSKTAIEPYLSDQWFVRMAELAEPALEVVRDGTIKFYPERHAQQYLAWLGEKRDWPISRQLWWGHRIPVWSGTERMGMQYRFNDPANTDSRAPRPVTVTRRLINAKLAEAGKPTSGGTEDVVVVEMVRPNPDGGEPIVLVCIPPGHDDVEQMFELFGFVQDPDVLDTWFSSGLWPHSTLGWPEGSAELAKWYPGSVLLTGRDIITLWVARMVMMGMYNMGAGASDGRGTGVSPVSDPKGRDAAGGVKDARPSGPNTGGTPVPRVDGLTDANRARALGIPFKHVAINPTILDGKGERMSKSKGNGVDPVEIIDTHGADALRFTLATMATETQDVRLPVKKDANGRNTSEKFDLGRNFCTKLWNASRFAIGQIGGTEGQRDKETKAPPTSAGGGGASSPVSLSPSVSLSLPDRWILARLSVTLAEVETALATYRFDLYAKSVYDFFWRDFCDWYVEAIKPAMKDPARAPQTAAVLAGVLDAALRLLHPVIPFVTETIWWRLNAVKADRSIPGVLDLAPSHRLVKAKWPAVPASTGLDIAAAEFARVQEVVGALRNLRNEHKVEPKRVVDVTVPGASPLLGQRELIEMFATCRLKEGGSPANAAKVLAGGIELLVEGVIDPDAEANRIAKRKDELSKQIATLEGRLASPSYTDKAPAKLVEQTRQQLADAKAELEKLG